MAVRHSSRRVDNSVRCLEECIGKYLHPRDSGPINIYSATRIAFIECFDCIRESRPRRYISLFSRIVIEMLKEKYSCNNVKSLLEDVSKLYEEITSGLRNRFTLHVIEMTTVSRLLIHLRSGGLPLEVSIAWDPIMNLPYIPSSSIKGAVRSYTSNIRLPSQLTDELLGSEDNIGVIRFIDAYPIGCHDRLVEPEIITPHYSEIENRIDETSANPTPIPLLSVAPRVKFKFIIAYTNSRKIPTQPKIEEIIKEALRKGLGAKTALGYGRLSQTQQHSQ